jgi:Rrf2 family protein
VKTSFRLEYACRVLTSLANHYGRPRLARIEDLARDEAVPANYLVRILNDLREAGVLESKRGTHGGYALARRPEDISLRDIAAAIEPDMVSSVTTQPGLSGPRVADAFRKISENLAEQLGRVTLRDLAGSGQANYDI